MDLAKRSPAILLGALLIAAVPTLQTASAATTSWSCFEHKRSEQRLRTKMNQARRNHGLERMRLDKQLSKVARRHSKRMARHSALFHSSMTKLGQIVTRWRLLAENVGRGDGIAAIHRAFMKSSAHKANILLGSLRHVGVGVVRRRGAIYVSVVFESRRDPGTTLSPPSC